MSVGKNDVLRFLRSRLGTKNAWATTQEIANHLQITTDHCAKLLYAARREDEGALLRMNKRMVGGILVREYMVTDAGVLKADRPTRNYAPIRDPKQMDVPVVVVEKSKPKPAPEPVDLGMLEDIHGPLAIAERPKPPLGNTGLTLSDLVRRHAKPEAATEPAPGPFEIPEAGVVALPSREEAQAPSDLVKRHASHPGLPPGPHVFEVTASPEVAQAPADERIQDEICTLARLAARGARRVVVDGLPAKLDALTMLAEALRGQFEASRAAALLEDIAADLQRVTAEA